jgi:hypothetical protein
MPILIPPIVLFTTASVLIGLRIARPQARYTWLVAVGGAVLSMVGVLAWQGLMPLSLTLWTWEPGSMFSDPIRFRADGLSWPYALSLSALTVTILLTSISQPGGVNPLSWAGSLAIGGLGQLAVTIDNPFTLLLAWAALDFSELLTLLTTVEGRANNQKAVLAFSSRALGIGVLIWASVSSTAPGEPVDFTSIPVGTSLLLVIASGLRLGVLPFHLPYSSESSLRRGFGTSIRLVSAASSLILPARVPGAIAASTFSIPLMALALIAAEYTGWMWLRAPDELLGRPYWIIGIASLSVTSALAGNAAGSVAWGCALILSGGTVFLTAVQHPWLNRILLIGVFSLSSLPYSLTAAGAAPGFWSILVTSAQALLMAGFVRHILRPGAKETLDSQPNWTRMIYPSGIGLLISIQILLGLFGWEGARRVGTWVAAMAACSLTLALTWTAPRLRIFTPTLAAWETPLPAGLAPLSAAGAILSRALGWLSGMITSTLEGEGGVMWTLLFLVLFVSIMSQGNP